jgi:hypothetical protein
LLNVLLQIANKLGLSKKKIAVKLNNNNNNNNNNNKLISYRKSVLETECVFRFPLQNFCGTFFAASYVAKRACEQTPIKTERTVAVLLNIPHNKHHRNWFSWCQFVLH